MHRGAWRATVHGFARVGHDLVTKLPSPEGLGASSCGHSHGGGPGQGGLQPSLCQHLRMEVLPSPWAQRLPRAWCLSWCFSDTPSELKAGPWWLHSMPWATWWPPVTTGVTLWEGVGFPVNRMTASCPGSDSTMPERGVLTVGLVPLHPRSGFLLTLLQEKGPSPMIQGRWWPLPAGRGRGRRWDCRRRTTYRAQYLVLDRAPLSWYSVLQVSLPDSWAWKHLPQMGGRTWETYQVLIAGGELFLETLELKPSISCLSGGKVAIPLWRMPSPTPRGQSRAPF